MCSKSRFTGWAHDAVRSGNIFWNWNTDLGANFIGSYSFYLLGSPFFWLTLPFPSAAVPYLMAPLLMLKFALSSLTAYAYLRRFVRPDFAVMAACCTPFRASRFTTSFSTISMRPSCISR